MNIQSIIEKYFDENDYAYNFDYSIINKLKENQISREDIAKYFNHFFHDSGYFYDHINDKLLNKQDYETFDNFIDSDYYVNTQFFDEYFKEDLENWVGNRFVNALK
jgi:hypothetical protein